MAERKAYFEIYGERTRARSRKVQRSGRSAPQWFPYKLEELSSLNPLKRFLNVGGLPVTMAEEKEGFIRNIKKTKAGQIGYLLEDMDEEVRRLKNAVLYVGFCSRQLKMVLKNEENELETDVSTFQSLLRSSTFSSERERSVSPGKTPLSPDNGMDDYRIAQEVSEPSESKGQKGGDRFEQQGEQNRWNQPKKHERAKTYLLRQLQRQLLEMNGRLKTMKLEASDLKKVEEHKHLTQLKKQIKKEKELKKENMIQIHQVNERFMQKRVRQEKLHDLRLK